MSHEVSVSHITPGAVMRCSVTVVTAAAAAAAATAAAGTSDLIADRMTLTPPKIESYFGISRGHIHHIDNSFGFDQRFPYRTPLQVGKKSRHYNLVQTSLFAVCRGNGPSNSRIAHHVNS